jgi:hypothetical protein
MTFANTIARAAHIVAAASLCSISVSAQQPAARDSNPPRRIQHDTLVYNRRAADSVLRARAPEEPTEAPRTRTPQQVGPTNPRMLPDVSAVGDLIGDLSPKGSTQEDGTRFGIREVELALQAVVDPYFRGDVFLGVSDLEGVSIEQAFLTTTALPGFEVRLGRYLMPVGKQNTTHRHDLHTIEYPWMVQQFFGPEGLKGTGVYASKVFAPFGWYQEFIVTAIDRFGEAPEDLQTVEPVNKKIEGLGYSARFRNYWDINESTNFELSASAITGRIEQPLSVVLADGVNAVASRQSTIGVDVTFRWRPLEQGLYKSFILQAEAARQVNQRMGDVAFYDGPNRDFTGGYAFARWQFAQRLYLGGRYDYVEDPLTGGEKLNAGSAYIEWFPSEFSKLVAGYEHLKRASDDPVHRILLQASFAIGPHKPHPF